MILPESIQSLINALERLPGIGPKSASRLAFYLLRATDDVSLDLALALSGLKENTAFCQECFNITEAGRERCEVCEVHAAGWQRYLCCRRSIGCIGVGAHRRLSG